jgi:hypothetical protein
MSATQKPVLHYGLLSVSTGANAMSSRSRLPILLVIRLSINLNQKPATTLPFRMCMKSATYT